jgi:hypothetical protein
VSKFRGGAQFVGRRQKATIKATSAKPNISKKLIQLAMSGSP